MATQKILVVDDDDVDRESMLRALEGRGFELLTASDGEEAIGRARGETPDLILLDVILPKKNGFQVCRILKTGEDTRDVKIVLVTSKSQDSDRFWGLKQGADEYLAKPVDPDELNGVLERLAS